MLEADVTLAGARARFAGRDPVAGEMADPPCERPLGDRIGAESELVRSLASLEAGPAGRKGRHERPGRSELIGDVEMIDRNAAVIEQSPLDEAMPQHLYEEVDITLGGARADGDLVQA